MKRSFKMTKLGKAIVKASKATAAEAISKSAGALQSVEQAPAQRLRVDEIASARRAQRVSAADADAAQTTASQSPGHPNAGPTTHRVIAKPVPRAVQKALADARPSVSQETSGSENTTREDAKATERPENLTLDKQVAAGRRVSDPKAADQAEPARVERCAPGWATPMAMSERSRFEGETVAFDLLPEDILISSVYPRRSDRPVQPAHGQNNAATTMNQKTAVQG